MLPRNFAKRWVVILVVLVLAVFISSYILSSLSEQSSLNKRTNSSRQRDFPKALSSQLQSGWKILYQKEGDTSGRTIIYEIDRDYVPVGAGMAYLKDGFPYIVGTFDGWEQINGSTDYLLHLKNPLSTKLLDPVLVVTSPGKVIAPRQEITFVGVENLNKVIKGSIGDARESVPEFYINNKLDMNRLKELIVTGDTLVIYPVSSLEGNKWKLKKDNNGWIIASTILLRRFNGIKDL